MSDMTTESQKAEQRCPYCLEVIETPHRAAIIRIGYDQVRRKKAVIREVLTFCSPPCAGSYQMGCEG